MLLLPPALRKASPQEDETATIKGIETQFSSPKSEDWRAAAETCRELSVKISEKEGPDNKWHGLLQAQIDNPSTPVDRKQEIISHLLTRSYPFVSDLLIACLGVGSPEFRATVTQGLSGRLKVSGEELKEKVKRIIELLGSAPGSAEGLQDAAWVLWDLGDLDREYRRRLIDALIGGIRRGEEAGGTGVRNRQMILEGYLEVRLRDATQWGEWWKVNAQRLPLLDETHELRRWRRSRFLEWWAATAKVFPKKNGDYARWLRDSLDHPYTEVRERAVVLAGEHAAGLEVPATPPDRKAQVEQLRGLMAALVATVKDSPERWLEPASVKIAALRAMAGFKVLADRPEYRKEPDYKALYDALHEVITSGSSDRALMQEAVGAVGALQVDLLEDLLAEVRKEMDRRAVPSQSGDYEYLGTLVYALSQIADVAQPAKGSNPVAELMKLYRWIPSKTPEERKVSQRLRVKIVSSVYGFGGAGGPENDTILGFLEEIIQDSIENREGTLGQIAALGFAELKDESGIERLRGILEKNQANMRDPQIATAIVKNIAALGRGTSREGAKSAVDALIPYLEGAESLMRDEVRKEMPRLCESDPSLGVLLHLLRLLGPPLRSEIALEGPYSKLLEVVPDDPNDRERLKNYFGCLEALAEAYEALERWDDALGIITERVRKLANSSVGKEIVSPGWIQERERVVKVKREIDEAIRGKAWDRVVPALKQLVSPGEAKGPGPREGALGHLKWLTGRLKGLPRDQAEAARKVLLASDELRELQGTEWDQFRNDLEALARPPAKVSPAPEK